MLWLCICSSRGAKPVKSQQAGCSQHPHREEMLGAGQLCGRGSSCRGRGTTPHHAWPLLAAFDLVADLVMKVAWPCSPSSLQHCHVFSIRYRCQNTAFKAKTRHKPSPPNGSQITRGGSPPRQAAQLAAGGTEQLVPVPGILSRAGHGLRSPRAAQGAGPSCVIRQQALCAAAWWSAHCRPSRPWHVAGSGAGSPSPLPVSAKR